MINERSKKLSIIFIIICFLQIFYIFYYRSGFVNEVFINSFNADAGLKQAVSREVAEVKIIINKNLLSDFYLSEKLRKDTYFYQRSIEFNYPIRLESDSKNIFFSIEENINPDCKIVETGKYLKLTKC
tara:strand:- start:6186 stop:6569 length:384 start_codon:yes stop_codon:yes gene_type:complete